METEGVGAVDVSVVVPAYGSRTSLDRCLTSLLVQRVRKEIIVVDDGASEEVRRLLRLYAVYHPGVVRVIQEPGPGLPGRMRNRGLDAARGRFVYFGDPEEELGPEVLGRMLAVADGQGADIVLRAAEGRAFPRAAAREALADGSVYDDLTCAKLFRRSMLERHRIRFDETLRIGEDMVFAVHAYCHAEVISAVAVGERGGPPSRREEPSGDPLAWLQMIRVPLAVLGRHVPPGPLRDRLLARHFRLDVLSHLGAPFLAAREEDREKIVAETADICAQWLTRGVLDLLSLTDRARVEALDDITHLVRLAEVEQARLTHRLTGLEWQGDRLLICGRVALDGIPGRPGLILRERASGREWRPGVTSVADLICAVIPARSLPAGVWDVHAVVECHGTRRTVPFGQVRDANVTVPRLRFAGRRVVGPFFTPDGRLGVDVGGHVIRVPGSVRLTRTEWVGRRLRVDGRVRVAKAPAAPAVRQLVWRERTSGLEVREPAAVTGPGTFSAQTCGFWPGVWDAYLELDVGGPPLRFPVKVDCPENLGRSLRWWRGPVRWTARPYATAVNRRLSTSVVVSSPRVVFRRLVRRIRRT
mgnify:FL=1